MDGERPDLGFVLTDVPSRQVSVPEQRRPPDDRFVVLGDHGDAVVHPEDAEIPVVEVVGIGGRFDGLERPLAEDP